jgi:hypothetical protein
MSEHIYNLAGAQFIFYYDGLILGLNYGSWPVTISLLEDTGRIFCPAPRTRMWIEKFLISHPNDMTEFILHDVLSA